MKKRMSVIGLFISAIIGLMGLGSAQDYVSYNLRQGAQDLISWAQSFAGPFIESIFGTGYLLEKLALFLVLISFIYISVKKIPRLSENKAVVWVITFSVSILATRYFGDSSWFQGVLIPYTVLGIVIASLIPLILFFFFIEGFDSGLIRKFGWTLFGLVFLGLWITKYVELGNLAWIYLLTAIIALLLLIFDKTIHVNYIMRFLINAGRGHQKDSAINDIRKQIFDAEDIIANPRSGPEDIKRANRIRREANARIKELLRD